MNVLIGSHGFPPQQAAGAELRAYRTARWLADHGHTVQVLAIDETGLAGASPSRLTLEEFDALRVRRLSYGLTQRAGTTEEYDNPVVRGALDDLLAAERPDVFHLISGYRMTGSALLAAQAHRVPAVVTLTDFWFLCPRIVLRRSTGELSEVPDDPAECALCLLNEGRRYRLAYRTTGGVSNQLLKGWWRATNFAGFGRARRLTEAMTARRGFQAEALAAAACLIAPSRFLAEMFKRHGLRAEQVRMLRQGVNIAPQPRPSDRPARPLIFGYIGQIADHKGIDILVRAFRQLPTSPAEARLIIYGDPAQAWPPFWQKLQAEIGGDPRITVAGPFASAQAPAIYAGLDVVVMPSIWYENSPNVILEAFACGVPVMASDLGGMAELIEHERNGFLFPANDAAALSRGLQRVIDQPQVLAQWRSALPPVKTIAQEMEELVEIYACAVEAAHSALQPAR